MADLLAEVADLRERLARAETGVDTAKAEVAAVRELADRLTAELAELRRPWWRRWLGTR